MTDQIPVDVSASVDPSEEPSIEVLEEPSVEIAEDSDEELEKSKVSEEDEEGSEGKMLSIPVSAMSKIKANERDKGRRETAQEYEMKLASVARILGFESWDEMENADPEEFWAAKQGQSRSDDGSRSMENPAEPETEVTMSEHDGQKQYPRYTKRLERENTRLLEEKKRLNRARAHEERRRRQLERELSAREAESTLRIAASRAGVQDIDYALHLLKKDMKNKSVDELASFDEKDYFSSALRKDHPYLYATEQQPATTGVDNTQKSKVGGAPAPGQRSEASNGADDMDAKKMSREDYQNLLRQRGLTDPSVGMPS